MNYECVVCFLQCALRVCCVYRLDATWMVFWCCFNGILFDVSSLLHPELRVTERKPNRRQKTLILSCSSCVRWNEQKANSTFANEYEIINKWARCDAIVSLWQNDWKPLFLREFRSRFGSFSRISRESPRSFFDNQIMEFQFVGAIYLWNSNYVDAVFLVYNQVSMGNISIYEFVEYLQF